MLSKLKRTFVLLAAGTLLVGVVTACSGPNTYDDSGDDNDNGSYSVPTRGPIVNEQVTLSDGRVLKPGTPTCVYIEDGAEECNDFGDDPNAWLRAPISEHPDRDGVSDEDDGLYNLYGPGFYPFVWIHPTNYHYVYDNDSYHKKLKSESKLKKLKARMAAHKAKNSGLPGYGKGPLIDSKGNKVTPPAKFDLKRVAPIAKRGACGMISLPFNLFGAGFFNSFDILAVGGSGRGTSTGGTSGTSGRGTTPARGTSTGTGGTGTGAGAAKPARPAGC